MKQIWNAGIIAITILILFSGLVFAKGGYGTKVVESCDEDFGRPLDDFVAPQIPIDLGWWDIGPNPGFMDEGDVIYLDFFPNGIVNVNDIRLTEWGSNKAGSKVTSKDNDIGQFIFPPGIFPYGFYFIDKFGTSSGYDLKDTVYIKVVPPAISTLANDVRLSPLETNMNISPPDSGSKINNSDPDIFEPINAIINTFPWGPSPGFGPMAYLRFYNANGNYDAAGKPIYDDKDDVYIDLPWTPPNTGYGTVSINDIRLSGPVT